MVFEAARFVIKRVFVSLTSSGFTTMLLDILTEKNGAILLFHKVQISPDNLT